jgi:outer membrane protein assembly factor BamB
VYALNAATGRRRWTAAAGGKQSFPFLIAAGGTVYLATGVRLYALDAATGHPR